MNMLPRFWLPTLITWATGILTCVAVETSVTYSVVMDKTMPTDTSKSTVVGAGLTEPHCLVPLADGEVRYFRIHADKTIKTKTNFYGPLEVELSLSMPATVCRGESSELYVTASIKNMAEHSRFGNISIRLFENDFAPWFPGNIKFEEPQGNIELGPGVGGITNIPPTWQTAKDYRVWVDSWEPAPDNVAEVRAECVFADSIPGQGSIYYSTDVLNIPLVDILPQNAAPGIRKVEGGVEIYWDAANACTDWSAPVSTASLVTISTVVDSVGGCTTDGQGSYTPGSKVTLTATPAPDYRFDHWEGSSLTGGTSASNPLVFTVTGECGLRAMFVRTTILTLQTEPANAGDLTGEGIHDLGAQVNITATPKTGYRFLRWDGGPVQSLTSSSTSVLLDQPMTLIAVFEMPYWLEVRAATGGSAGGSGNYVRDSMATITAEALPGFQFLWWQGEGIENPGIAQTRVRVDKPKQVTAVFGGGGVGNIEYYIDTDPGFGNGIAVNLPGGGGRFTADTSSLVPGTHHLVVRVKDDGGVWVNTEQHYFFVAEPPPPASVIEYAFDATNDSASFVPVAFVDGQASFQPLVNGLTEGRHHIYMRQRFADGQLTSGMRHDFLLPPNDEVPTIERVEYFQGVDPGEGNGRHVPTSGGTSLDASLGVPGPALTTGFNSVFFRAMGSNGLWSSIVKHDFLAEPIQVADPITEIEYYLTRNGTAVPGSWQSMTVPHEQLMTSNFTAALPTAAAGEAYELNVLGVTTAGLPGLPGVKSFALSINPGALYQAWVNDSGHFPGTDAGDPAIAGFLADPDGDGSPNGCEYAFGTNPRSASSKFNSTAETQGDHLVIRYRQKMGGEGTVGTFYTAGGVRYTVQYVESLEQPAWKSGGDVVEVVGAPVDNGDGTETVTVRAKTPISAAPRGFLRIYLELL